MEFGNIPYNNLNPDTFKFGTQNQPFLSGVKTQNPKLYIGLTRWAAEHFQNSLYPAKTIAKNYLTEYGKRFNAIELNATHYHIPTPQQVSSWYNRVESDDFHFCPKFSKLISHQGGLNLATKAKLTDSFVDVISGFSNKLGPSFIQLADYVSNKSATQAIEFLKYLPANMQTCIETRHHSWFNTQESKEAFAQQLNAINKGWVITDTPGRRDAAHLLLTIPHVFIRFVAKGNTEIDLFRLQQWKVQLNNWFNIGLESCHFFIHVHDKDDEIQFALHAQSQLNTIINP